VDSEVGTLRTVLLHRPGAELKRFTHRNADKLLFNGVPWVGRAQQEHDVFAQALRDRGVEVLYLTEMLQDALEYQAARDQAAASVLGDARLGDELRGQLRGHLAGLDPEAFAQVLIAGLTPGEFRAGRGVVYQLLGPHDFVIDPLPNLLFTRDPGVWIGDCVAVSSPAMRSRRREATLIQVICEHHPRFAGTRCLYQPGFEYMEGGDVMLLAPGVIAVGTGERTTAAGVERLARHAFDAGLAHTVLAVPIAQGSATMHLDNACTMVDVDAVVMYPAAAYTLTAHRITPRADGLRVSHPQPFLEAAAQAMAIERLRVIDIGLPPDIAERGRWDDGNNALAIGPRLAVSYERNVETNASLEAAGIEVIRVPGSELSSGRGGPRCMSCPIGRDPAIPRDAVAPVRAPDVRGLANVPAPAAAPADGLVAVADLEALA
jgi:arginine deiminase